MRLGRRAAARRRVSDAWFEKTGIRIVDGIGSTEMLHIFIASPADEARPGSCGRPVPGYEARIVGDDMQTLPPGRGRPARRARADGLPLPRRPAPVDLRRDGWNLTGDAFSMDEDGYFWFQARTDDMIISSGYNISGFEVEAALLEHPAVAECAVVAAPDEERGHVVKAYVVSRERGRRPRSCRTTSRRGSRRTSTRAGSSSSRRCRARRRARSSATSCASASR